MVSVTSWTLIREAAGGADGARSEFARRYLPVVRAYLAARWRGTAYVKEIDDAVQEVFVDCFRSNGVLERASPGRPGGFRAFLLGVSNIVAARTVARLARRHDHEPRSEADPDQVSRDQRGMSRLFDRAWAQAIMREAADLQDARARASGAAALRRVELLRLRFQDHLPIRDIASNWGVDPAKLHHEYAQARKEFRDALREVVGLYEECPREQLEEQCSRLLELLGET
jgi:RNA polymerase sigma-70 factor (ECF subfamily)